VIKGWEEAVQTMLKGEVAEFVLAPDYAYGANGSPPKIPPNATLKFEIELLEWTLDKDISKAKDGSVLKRVLREGDGWQRPKGETKVQARVLTRLAESGPVVHEANLDVTIGDGSLPPGLLRLLKEMKKGEHATAVVKPQHAYGEKGNAVQHVPPNATLYYEVELTDMQKEKEPWEMTNEEKFSNASTRREHGNQLFKQGHLKRAAKRYKSALSCLTSDHAFNDQQKKEARAAQVPCHLNLAAVAIKRQQWKAALESAKKALEIDPNNTKALFRHAQASAESGELIAAQQDLRKALELQPNDADLLALNKRVQQMQAVQDKRDKAVFAKMFSA
jgi:FK506-binding protein 4/5